MAGTRLHIVVSFWILLWIWIGISIYESGLYQDAFFVRYVIQPIHKMYDDLWIMQQQQQQFGYNSTDSVFLLKNHQVDTTRIMEWKQQQALLLPLIQIHVQLSTSSARQQHGAASKWQHIFDNEQQGISIKVVHSQSVDDNDDDVAECSNMKKKTVLNNKNNNDSATTTTTTLPDVWICDSSSSTDNNSNASTTRASTKTRIVYDKSMVETTATTTRMIVYPSSSMLQQQEQQQQQQQMIQRILFPTSASSSLHYPPQHQKQSHRTTTTKWQIRLILDTNITQWKYIVAYIQEWIQQQQQQQSGSITLEFQTIQRTDQLVNLVRRRSGDSSNGSSSSSNSVTGGDGLSNNKSRSGEQQQHLLSISDVTQALKDTDDDTFETTQTRVVYIYVPEHIVHLYTDDDDAHASNNDIDPATMSTSTVAQVGMHRWIHVVDRTIATSAVMDDIPLQETLIQIHNHIMTQYWGIPWYTTTTMDENDVIIETTQPLSSSSHHDGTMTVPALYQKLYYGRVLPPLYETVIVQTQTVGTMLETASVSIPSSMIRHFILAMDDITQAQELYKATVETNTFLTAAPQIHQLLLDATQVLQDIQMDHLWVEPSIDFPLEQYAAIFAPLLFPLLLPLLATLVREYKRYRRLIVQQQRQQTKEKVQ